MHSTDSTVVNETGHGSESDAMMMKPVGSNDTFDIMTNQARSDDTFDTMTNQARSDVTFDDVSCKLEDTKHNGYANAAEFGTETKGTLPEDALLSADESRQDTERKRSWLSCICARRRQRAAERDGMTRQQWAGEADFVLACIGNAVGLGNLWRFPYLCYDSGGGAFLIPYFIMLVFTGIPLLYLEVSIGQFTRQGPTGAIKKLCPFFQGAGMGTVVLSFLLTTYYNVILTWGLYYLITSCVNPLPWSSCDNAWNSPACWNDNTENTTRPNNSRSPTQEYFENRVLKQSSGLEEPGAISWQLAVLLAVAWVLVFFCLFKGVRWTGKVVYFTAIFPYVIIIALLIRGLTLPGAMMGVDFFINPEWQLLMQPKVWVNAAAQNFNSIGIAFGSMIAFSSYSKPDAKIFRNSMIICAVNSATSILAGFAIFSVLGYVAFIQGQEVKEVVSQGPGLVFQVYPAAFSSMSYPGAQVFAFLFFFMLLCLAIDSQFASVEVVLTTLEDHYGRQLRSVFRHKWVTVLIFCVIAYFLSLPNITQGGIYYFKIIDNYSSGMSLMLIAFFEVIAVTWIYGAKRLAKDIEMMTGKSVGMYWLVCWYGISPAFILAIMLFNWAQYSPVRYDDYVYPAWGQGLGWVLASLSLICIPLGMVKALVEAPGSGLLQKFRNTLKPLEDILPDTTGSPVAMETAKQPPASYTMYTVATSPSIPEPAVQEKQSLRL